MGHNGRWCSYSPDAAASDIPRLCRSCTRPRTGASGRPECNVSELDQPFHWRSARGALVTVRWNIPDCPLPSWPNRPANTHIRIEGSRAGAILPWRTRRFGWRVLSLATPPDEQIPLHPYSVARARRSLTDRPHVQTLVMVRNGGGIAQCRLSICWAEIGRAVLLPTPPSRVHRTKSSRRIYRDGGGLRAVCYAGFAGFRTGGT